MQMSSNGPIRYDAFLSYAHHDAADAAAVQRGLHRVGRKVGRLRALRVFRDATDLHANPDLWGRIEGALDASRFLILLTSPAARESTWVNREVEHFVARRGLDQVLFVVVGGDLVWRPDLESFDPESSAAPRSLTAPGSVTREPLYTTFDGPRPIDLRNPGIRTQLAAIAAPIHGKTLDELASEDRRELRRFRRLRRGAVAGLSALLVASLAFAVFALVQRAEADRQRSEAETQRAEAIAQRNEAETQRSEAIAQRNQATANGLISASRLAAPTDPALATALAAESVSLTSESGGEAVSALIDARNGLADSWVPDTALGDDSLTTEWATSADGAVLALGSTTVGRVQIVDTERREVSAVVDVHRDGVASMALSHDGALLATGSFDGALAVWNTVDGSPVAEPFELSRDERVTHIRFAERGEIVVVATADGVMSMWSTVTGGLIAGPVEHGGQLLHVEVLPDESTVATVLRNTTETASPIWLTDVGDGRSVGRLDGHTGWVGTMRVDVVGGVMSSLDDSGRALVWDARAFDLLHDLGAAGRGLVSAAFHPRGRFFATLDVAGIVRVWDAHTGVATGSSIATSMVSDELSTIDLRFSPTGDRLIVVVDGHLSTFAVPTGEQLGVAVTPQRYGETALLLGATFADDGATLITFSSKGTAHTWQFADPGLRSLGIGFTDYPVDAGRATMDPSGATVAVVNNGELTTWDLQGRNTATASTGGAEGITEQRITTVGPRFDSSGRYVAYASDESVVQIWDTEVGEHVGPSLVHGVGDDDRFDSRIVDMAFTSSRWGLATVSADGTVRVWDVRDATLLRILVADPDDTLAVLDPLGTYVVSVRSDGRVVRFEFGTSEVSSIANIGSDVDSLVVANGGETLVVVAGGQVHLVDAASGARVREPIEPTVPDVVVISPGSGSAIAIIGTDNATAREDDPPDAIVEVFDVATGERIGDALVVGDLIRTPAISSDGEWLAVVNGTGLQLWDVIAGERLGGSIAGGDRAIFSPSGQVIVVTRPGTIRVWNEPWSPAAACEIIGPYVDASDIAEEFPEEMEPIACG